MDLVFFVVVFVIVDNYHSLPNTRTNYDNVLERLHDVVRLLLVIQL